MGRQIGIRGAQPYQGESTVTNRLERHGRVVRVRGRILNLSILVQFEVKCKQDYVIREQ